MQPQQHWEKLPTTSCKTVCCLCHEEVGEAVCAVPCANDSLEATGDLHVQVPAKSSTFALSVMDFNPLNVGGDSQEILSGAGHEALVTQLGYSIRRTDLGWGKLDVRGVGCSKSILCHCLHQMVVVSFVGVSYYRLWIRIRTPSF